MPMDYDESERGFFQKYGFVAGIGAMVLIGGGLVANNVMHQARSPVVTMPEVVMIRPLPPPPPPPPKPPDPPKETEDKMVEQTPVDTPEPKPDDAPKPSAPLTTGVTGPGNDGFGLGAGGGGGGGGGGGRAHSRFGWFAGEVQATVQAALARNPVTKNAQFAQRVRIWADPSGRVVRVRLEGSTGDASLDQAVRDALDGLQFQDAPPKDMPMPIVMRLVARRPNSI